jgi:hypothetical protein
MEVFNKVEKDFKTMREYIDYLEEVEDDSESIHVGVLLPAIRLVPNIVLTCTTSLLVLQVVLSILLEEPNAEECKAKD